MNSKDDTQATQTIEKDPRIDWNKWDAIFLAVISAYVVLESAGALLYLCGRFEPYLILLVFLYIYPAIGVLFLLFIAVGTKRLVVDWTRYTRRKRLIRIIQIWIPVTLIALFLLSVLTPIDTPLYQPGYKPFTRGFRERMKHEADIPAIRNWLGTLQDEDCAGETIDLFSDSDYLTSQWPDSVQWPKSLRVFNPHYVMLDLDENGNPKVRLTWGAALGHWGVEIGMEDMEIPASDFSRWGEYRLAVVPGVYVWHELQ